MLLVSLAFLLFNHLFFLFEIMPLRVDILKQLTWQVIINLTSKATLILTFHTLCEFILFHVVWRQNRFSHLLTCANLKYFIRRQFLIQGCSQNWELSSDFVIRAKFQGLRDTCRGYRSRFQLIFVQWQSSVSLLVKPLISFHCVPTSLARYSQKAFLHSSPKQSWNGSC